MRKKDDKYPLSQIDFLLVRVNLNPIPGFVTIFLLFFLKRGQGRKEYRAATVTVFPIHKDERIC